MFEDFCGLELFTFCFGVGVLMGLFYSIYLVSWVFSTGG